ncbi:MAG: hypothetical protein QME61_01140 [Patescibacteria group bacterium]|nr:hypothetical protein [Patescibacteria group bacterium]
MLLETETSIYRLEQKRQGGFRLTKIALKKGHGSSIEVGEILEGEKILITPDGIYIGKSKTSPLQLPLVD